MKDKPNIRARDKIMRYFEPGIERKKVSLSVDFFSLVTWFKLSHTFSTP